MDFEKGDKIKATGEIEIEGFFVKEEDNYVIIKLSSGYDVVLNKDKFKFELKEKNKEENKLSNKENKESFKGKRNISLIATGGTIASKVDYKIGGVSPSLDPSYYYQIAPELKEEVEAETFMNIFSENLLPKHWIEIGKEINKKIKEGYKGIILTMGTDTMHYTASALSFMLNPLSVPVVITGSQRSSDRGSTDAHQNLVCSLNVAKSEIGEVTICMHGEISDSFNLIIRGTRARKMHTERRDAFRSINDKPIGKVYPNGKIEFINSYRKKAEDTVLNVNLDDKVQLLYSYPGFDGEVIKYYVDKGFKGLVIAATGFGNLPMEYESVKEGLKYANEKNVPIVITSQTIYGSTNPFVYSTSREMSKFNNIIYVKDMLTETAYVKLMFALGKTKDMEEIKDFMKKNLVGEISEKSEIDTFLI
ncbi:MAG: Glu-tRNA(Gln) amidotransferase subunit GatD [Candidatus Parvarchaeota archaeon]|nr:Glu-tRNA(Gln) amidotransferase subunit GatD [Candidatus Rehaiarchaeum fermentans]